MSNKKIGRFFNIAVLAGVVLFLASSSSFAFDGNMISHIKHAKPKITGDVTQLIEKQRSAPRGVTAVFGAASWISNRATVVLELQEGVNISNLQLAGYGGYIKRKYNNLVKVNMPVARIEALVKAMPQVKFVRNPDRPIPLAISEGVSLTGVSGFQSAGYKGKAVKVAIIDLGFIGLSSAKTNGELPSSVITQDYTGQGIETSSNHGTGVAEIVYDMAPEAQLYLIKIEDSVDLGAAKDYCKQQGIKIINHSVGWFNTGAGDGTGTVCNIANDAKNNGILWVNAAGNQAERHWQGMFVTTLPDGTYQAPDGHTYRMHEFIAGNVESNSLSITAGVGETIQLYMRWNDWPTTNKSYSLFLYDKDLINDDTAAIVASAGYIQNGTLPPAINLAYFSPTAKTYYLIVISVDVDPSSNVEIEIFSASHNLEYKTAESSLMEPADATGVLAAAAVSKNNWTTNISQEIFSSQGPTNGWAGSAERTKPDISGPDGVTNYTYGSFYGTSASSPHVAGAAAALLSMQPNMTVDELRAELEVKAVDTGASGKDNIYGSGKLALPAPSVYLSNVVINEFVPNPDGANSEWVELYNKGSQAINIGGCWLDDVISGGSAAQQILPGTIIQPGGFYVHTLDAGDGFLNNTGDEINFLAPDSTTVVETKSFGSSSSYPDQSIYRLPDGDAWQSGFDDSPTKSSANNGPTPKGSLKVTVKNKDSANTPDALIVLYNSQSQEVARGTTVSDGAYTFTNLSVGTYSYEVYYPSNNPDTRSFWAAGNVVIFSGQVNTKTVVQINPYINSISIKDINGQPQTIFAKGDTVKISVEAKNNETVTRNTYPVLYIDGDKAVPYYAQLSKLNEAVDLVSGQPSIFNFDFVIPNDIESGVTLYINAEINSKYGFAYSRTDLGSWGWSFQIEASANQPPVLSDIPNQTINRNESFSVISLDNYVNDPDNADSEITWSYSDNTNLNISLDSATRVATIAVKDSSWTGQEQIVFTATDPGGLFASKTVTFTINELPVKTVMLYAPKVNKRIADVNNSYEFSVYYFDETNSAPTVKNVVIDGSNCVLNLTSGSAGNGVYSYSTTFTESDSHNYYFEFADSTGKINLRYPSVGSLNEPIVTGVGGPVDLIIDNFEDAQANINSMGFNTDDDLTCISDEDIAGTHKISWDAVDDYWYTCLASKPNYMQAKKYNVISLRIKSDTLNPNVVLRMEDIQKLREDINLKDYAVIDNTWRTIDIPLSDFVYKGLHLDDLFSVALIFKDTTGAIYIDDIKLKYDSLLVPVDLAHSPTIKPPSKGTAQIISNKLFVDNRSFLVKSVGYQPIPIGETHATWNRSDTAIFDRDFPLIKAMNANTIKTWSDASSVMFDKAQEYGLKVVTGFYIDGSFDLSDATVRSILKTNFRNYVRLYKDKPSLLAWSVGNEQNLSNGDNSFWYSLANELAQIAYEEEGMNYHPVLIDNADIPNVGYAIRAADDSSLGYVDAWGITFYRGRTLGFAFFDVLERTHKPVFVSEFGIDAYDNNAQIEDQTTQAMWDKDKWNEISTGENCIGGSVMEYCDEWWKWLGAGSFALAHDTGGWPVLSGAMPDNFTNEEYFGLMSVQDNGTNPDNMLARKAYYSMQERFNHSTRSFIDISRPATPLNINATILNKDVTLTWDPVSSAAGYNIYRSQQSGMGFVRLNSSPVTDTTYTDANLQEIAYYYIVTVVNSDHIPIESLPTDEKVANLGGNLAPQLQVLPDKTINEDTTDNTMDLWQYASDDRDTNDQLVFSAQSNTNVDCVVTIDSNRYINIAPKQNWNGVDNVTIRVTDRDGLYAERVLKITVNPINDPPVISGVLDQQGTEDIAFTLDISPYISDIDNPKSSLVITENSPYATVSSQTIIFNYSNGIITEQVTITVSDGQLTASQTITVNITPVNDPPVFNPVTAKTVNEGEEFKFTVNATDVDSPMLIYSASNLPSGASFNPATREFKWIPSYTQGRDEQYTVTITVSDGQLSVSTNVNIKVNNVEQPHSIPVVTVTSPVDGSEVSGIAQVTASITNTSGLESIYAYLYVDSNSMALDVSAPYSFSWNTTNSTNGNHSLKVKVSYSYYEGDIKKTGWVESAVVNVTVNNPVYDVRITSPANNSTVSGAVNISATAAGASFVYYYIDGVWKGQSFSPFSYAWDTATIYNGSHTIFTKAFYSATLQWVTSSTITVTVNNAAPPNIPTINITSPAEDSTVSGTTTIAAEVVNAAASGVYFYIDNKYKYYDSAVPYQYLWNTAAYPDGNHAIKVTAYIPATRKYITRTAVVRGDN